ncbi:hypothetical protein BKA70DRAFT_1287340 [Coprinopsis sp. MPI-PUGE-AT-0042]|nr:hypothetical protein BKA70DRAFT_1287340 [Coprinopsis sp. MPI-PUGE-AT-0042]
MSGALDSEGLPFRSIGSPAFLPELLDYIRSNANSTSVPVDPVIIRSILLCIIAGNKHLILRTPEEDIGLVVKIVSWTLSNVFSYSNQKVKLRSYSSSLSPEALLASLFLSPNHPLASRDDARQSMRSSVGHSSFGKPTNRGSGLDHSRTSSYATDLASSYGYVHARSTSSGKAPPDPKLFRGHSESEKLEDGYHSIGLAEAPRALVVSGLEKTGEPLQRALAEALSDKFVALGTPQSTKKPDGFVPDDEDEEENNWPLPPGFIMIYICPVDAKERPPIHRNLLDRFAMSHNIQISPSIRQALRSIPVSPLVHSNPFLPQSNPNSPSISIHSPLPQQAYSPPYFTKPLPNSHGQPLNASRHANNLSSSSSVLPQTLFPPAPENPLLPPWFLDLLRRYNHKTHLAPHLDLYLSDLFSAVRHHPRLDGMLLTASARKDAEDLARAARVLGTDSSGMELLRSSGNAEGSSIGDHETTTDELSEHWVHPEIATSNSHMQLHAPALAPNSPQYSKATTLTVSGDETAHLLRQRNSSPFTSARSHAPSDDIPPRGAGSSVRSRAAGHRQRQLPFDRSEEGPVEEKTLEFNHEVEVLDVTEGDVARMMPRVVAHRVRLRDGPEDEVLASAVVGATFDVPHAGEGGVLGVYGAVGVKDILVEILNKV